ncbi:His-Xaa-Ser system-associated MauG-like protein [Hoeflea sp. WL0058]|uniref:His-Xaa-Ser system-associated MauG-like protein n=2 Tax=Flavimaribacter sediminis TaxID=2865987 RepID=A0AAE3D2P2_9HYPH|nr:His-Xaa-Ser system-associated MauG-like protein [Flavimaribacter sediminis]
MVLILPVHADGLREETLRQAAVSSGLVPAAETHVLVSLELAKVGKLLFESKLLSPSNTIACATCHIDRFGSADGLQQAVGIGGTGIGVERLKGNGRIVPRNTLPFWGRGGVAFNVFFWDGKVDGTGGRLHSQFGSATPSHDPLVVAVHLPPAELSEMVGTEVDEDKVQTETVNSAELLYSAATQRVAADPKLGVALARARRVELGELAFLDIAEAIAAFIRTNFQVSETAFHRFVFDGKPLPRSVVEGGLIFYGKGGCASCHNGPYFSDLEFHGIPFPPAGFGKNGFGVDYGRYNVTLDPSDRGRFRTPPLYNVRKTAPYGHSGSIKNLADAITIHFDPLGVPIYKTLSPVQRAEFYRSLKVWSSEPVSGNVLYPEDIIKLVDFLSSLEYTTRWSVESE